MMARRERAVAVDIHQRLAGRERELFRALGIDLPKAGGHRRCPFPDHTDEHPSWRWDQKRHRWFCSCTPKGGTAIDAVARLRGLDLAEAGSFALKMLKIDGEPPKGKGPRRAHEPDPPVGPAPRPETPEQVERGAREAEQAREREEVLAQLAEVLPLPGT